MGNLSKFQNQLLHSQHQVKNPKNQTKLDDDENPKKSKEQKDQPKLPTTKDDELDEPLLKKARGGKTIAACVVAALKGKKLSAASIINALKKKKIVVGKFIMKFVLKRLRSQGVVKFSKGKYALTGKAIPKAKKPSIRKARAALNKKRAGKKSGKKGGKKVKKSKRSRKARK